MDDKLKKLFAKTKAVVYKEDFLVAELPSAKINYSFLHKVKPFAVVNEGNKFTIVAEARNWLYLKAMGAKIRKSYSLLLFGVELPFDITGYFAAVSEVLAENKISILAFPSYTKDYVLVNSKDKRKAVSALNKFINSCK